MACKRLEEHTFTWLAIKDGVMNLCHAQFEALFVVSKTRLRHVVSKTRLRHVVSKTRLRHDGLDWRRVRAVEVRAPMAVE